MAGVLYTPVTLGSGLATSPALDAEFVKIQTALAQCLNRDGDNGDNAMNVDLDLDSNDLLNKGADATASYGIVNLDGTDGTINYEKGNISTVVRDGVGLYTITFDSSYAASTDYVVYGSAEDCYVSATTQATGSVVIEVRDGTNSGALADVAIVYVKIEGTLS